MRQYIQTLQTVDMNEPITIGDWVEVVDEGKCQVDSIFIDTANQQGIQVQVMQNRSTYSKPNQSDLFWDVDVDQID